MELGRDTRGINVNAIFAGKLITLGIEFKEPNEKPEKNLLLSFFFIIANILNALRITRQIC